MSNLSIVTCDGCGRTQPAQLTSSPGSRWLRVVPMSREPGGGIGRPTLVRKDFCGTECLVAHCVKLNASGKLGTPPVISLDEGTGQA